MASELLSNASDSQRCLRILYAYLPPSTPLFISVWSRILFRFHLEVSALLGIRKTHQFPIVSQSLYTEWSNACLYIKISAVAWIVLQ